MFDFDLNIVYLPLGLLGAMEPATGAQEGGWRRWYELIILLKFIDTTREEEAYADVRKVVSHGWRTKVGTAQRRQFVFILASIAFRTYGRRHIGAVVSSSISIRFESGWSAMCVSVEPVACESEGGGVGC